MAASEGGQGQYSVSILEGMLGSGGWAAGNLADLTTLLPSPCLRASADTQKLLSGGEHGHVTHGLKLTLFVDGGLPVDVGAVIWKESRTLRTAEEPDRKVLVPAAEEFQTKT